MFDFETSHVRKVGGEFELGDPFALVVEDAHLVADRFEDLKAAHDDFAGCFVVGCSQCDFHAFLDEWIGRVREVGSDDDSVDAKISRGLRMVLGSLCGLHLGGIGLGHCR
jgi:hypothetical protein